MQYTKLSQRYMASLRQDQKLLQAVAKNDFTKFKVIWDQPEFPFDDETQKTLFMTVMNEQQEDGLTIFEHINTYKWQSEIWNNFDLEILKFFIKNFSTEFGQQNFINKFLARSDIIFTKYDIHNRYNNDTYLDHYIVLQKFTVLETLSSGCKNLLLQEVLQQADKNVMKISTFIVNFIPDNKSLQITEINERLSKIFTCLEMQVSNYHNLLEGSAAILDYFSDFKNQIDKAKTSFKHEHRYMYYGDDKEVQAKLNGIDMLSELINDKVVVYQGHATALLLRNLPNIQKTGQSL